MPLSQLFRWHVRPLPSFLHFLILLLLIGLSKINSNTSKIAWSGDTQRTTEEWENCFASWLPFRVRFVTFIGTFSVNSLVDLVVLNTSVRDKLVCEHYRLLHIIHNPPNMGYHPRNRPGRKWSIPIVLILGVVDLKFCLSLAWFREVRGPKRVV